MRFSLRVRVWIVLIVALSMSVCSVIAQNESQMTCDPAPTTEKGIVQEKTLMFDGTERHYLYYVPEAVDLAQAAPLVLSFHGFASNPRMQMMVSQWNDVADENGFIVVYPQGTEFPLRWNTGENFLASAEPADDVGFVDALIATLKDDLCIDASRIYASGLSNGGGMSNRLACELSDQIVAIGPVAGAYSPLAAGCHPARPVPVMAFHGNADPIVPYGGGETGGSTLPDIPTWAAEWAERDGCNAEPEIIPPTGDAGGVRYVGCTGDVEVILYTIDEGGHTWPGGQALPSFITGKTSTDIDATELLWAFFSRYSLPEDQ